MAKSRRSSRKKAVSQREKSRKSAGRRNSSSDSSRSDSDRSRSSRSYSSSSRSSRSSPSSRSEKSNSTSPLRSDRSSSRRSRRPRNSRLSDRSSRISDQSGRSAGKPRLARRSIRIAKKKVAVRMKNKRQVSVSPRSTRSRRVPPEELSSRVEASRGSPARGLNESVAHLPDQIPDLNLSKIDSTTDIPHSPNSGSGRSASTPLRKEYNTNAAHTLLRMSLLRRAKNAQRETGLTFTPTRTNRANSRAATPIRITGNTQATNPVQIAAAPVTPKIVGRSRKDRTAKCPGPAKIDGPGKNDDLAKPEGSGKIEVSLEKEIVVTPIKASNLTCGLTAPSDVRCNLKLPIFIESIQKVRVSPQNEEIIIETRTILMSNDASEADSKALYLVRPSVNHASFEKEKGRNEETSDNKVLIGKNTVLIERHTVIQKSEFEENLSAQTKKEHNRIGTCKVDGLTGPLSIHCASGTVVNGDIYNKKELITIFLTEQPVSLKREELNGILSRRLIREEVPEVEKNTIKSDEKMMTNGKYILTLERDVRIFADNEMWTNENEVVTTEERSFEVGKIANGDVTILERNHQVSKAILDMNPSFYNRSALPSVTGPYDSSVYSTPQAKIAHEMLTPQTDRTAQTTIPLQKTPETLKSSKDNDLSIRNRSKARENLISNDSVANTPVKKVLFPPKSPDVTLPATPNWIKPMMPLQTTPESPESYKDKKEASSSKSPDRKKSKIVTPVYISSIATTPTKRLSLPSKSPGATLTPIRMKPLQNTAKIRATTPTNTLNVRNAATPNAVAGSQSPSMLSRSMNPITPKKTVTPKKSESPLRKKNDTESRRDHKKSVETSVTGVEHFERTINISTIDISKTGTVNTETACKLTVPMEVVAKINGDTYKLKINLAIVNDSKEIKFVAKKFVVDGKTLWHSEEENVSSKSKQNN